MREIFLFICGFLVVFSLLMWFTDNSVSCDSIPVGERYKYARMSVGSDKCVMMSESEIKNSLIEAQREKIEDLQEKLLYTEVERDWALVEKEADGITLVIEENSPD